MKNGKLVALGQRIIFRVRFQAVDEVLRRYVQYKCFNNKIEIRMFLYM